MFFFCAMTIYEILLFFKSLKKHSIQYSQKNFHFKNLKGKLKKVKEKTKRISKVSK